jgi:hypothetical protein
MPARAPSLTAIALATFAVLAPSPAMAQDVAEPPATTAPAAPPPDPHAPPPPRTGFQMAMRTGYAIPFGNVDGSASMGDSFSGQVAFLLDLGGKPIPSLFLGGYVGLGLGGASGQLGSLCSADNLTCVTASLRIGAEVLYSFLPEGSIDPWIGYGIGLESTGFGASNGNDQINAAAAGWEFGHFMGGVDFRLSKDVGIGPLIDFSVGQYTRESVSENGNTLSSGTPSQTALHEWLLIGGRVVIFP